MYKFNLEKIISTLLLSLVISCNEPCLDMETIATYNIEWESWKIEPQTSSVEVTSSVGISDLASISYTEQEPADAIWDDCGNVTQSARWEAQYSFQNFPINIYVILNKQGEEDGFEFQVLDNSQFSYFKLNSQETSQENPIELLSNSTINQVEYPKLFKVNLNQNQGDAQIKTFYYAPTTGIIQITLNSGISLNIN